jgi:S1-C subfamily serine protease
MANKIIIGILVLLVLLTGGIGYYSYTLNQQIDQLSERLTALDIEQAARIDTVSDELISLRTETLSKFGALEGQINDTLADIDTLEGEIEAVEERIADMESEINNTASELDILDERLTDAVNEFSEVTNEFSDAINEFSGAVIDAGEVFQKVGQATVRINNGQSTVGSGFILDTEGHVVTAQHVIDKLSPIYVIMHNGMMSKATVVGSCEVSDVAVLQLEKNPDIEPPPLADSSQIKIGELVVAIGSPLELRDTLTAGIISQLNRTTEIQYNEESRWVPNLLQFDAAVNFGNSGCPLANADGEIIGIVVARIDPIEGDGIYYAVSSNKARRVIAAIIDHGFFDYPWVGVGIAEITPQVMQDMGLETVNGVLVSGVFSGSPAEAADIKGNDIIISINGIPVRDSADLTSYLGEFVSPGDVITIGIRRGTAEIELSLEVGKRQE